MCIKNVHRHIYATHLPFSSSGIFIFTVIFAAVQNKHLLVFCSVVLCCSQLWWLFAHEFSYKRKCSLIGPLSCYCVVCSLVFFCISLTSSVCYLCFFWLLLFSLFSPKFINKRTETINLHINNYKKNDVCVCACVFVAYMHT